MTSSKFDFLLSKVRNNDEVKPFELLDIFPYQKIVDKKLESKALFCFISLSCMKCIDLLPEINNIANAFSGEFILVSCGAKDENQEIAEHFGFSFPVATVVEDDFQNHFRVQHTPYGYAIG